MTDPVPLVVATANTGKAAEFARLLAPVFVVDSLPTGIALPPETGRTFADNSRLKAESVFAALGRTVAVLADDSGLEVKALDGRPGVHSARYAGEMARDADNVRKLLDELEGVEDRSARFVCSLVLIMPEEIRPGAEASELAVEGFVAGCITAAPCGRKGFGYDPVFQPDGWDLTLAEADPVDKDRISHRGAAARMLLAKFKALTKGACAHTADPRLVGHES
jgi:XTP/dITP diphosphohydrolase